MLLGMAVVEHTLTHFLRNSGEVLGDVERWDVIIRRRDGEDLYIKLDSRESSQRDVIGLLARLLIVAGNEPKAAKRMVNEVAALLPWTSFLPADERQQFVTDLVIKAAGCVAIDNFEPLEEHFWRWEATAEVYANPEIMAKLNREPTGPPVPLKRPKTH